MNAHQQLPAQAAVPLAAALVQELAETVGTRVMILKGVAAEAQGLREPRIAADVDALVDPAGFDALVGAFMERGWRARFTPPTEVRHIPGHSVTLVHAAWPCDLDLHFFFVGTFADPPVSFAALWEGHETHTVAGRPITTPSIDGHRVILAVNTVRDKGTERAAAESDRLGEHLRANPEVWQRMLSIAERTRSLSMIREFAAVQGLSLPEHDLNQDEFRQLTCIVKYHNSGLGNLRFHLTDPSLSMREKLRVLRYYLYKPETMIALENPAFHGGRWATFRVNWGRFGKGVHRWRVSRRVEVSGGSEAARGLKAGSAFLPKAPVRQVTYAELRETPRGIVLENAPLASTASVKHDDFDLSATCLRIAESARFETQSELFLLSLDRAYLDANPTLTPPVVSLDAAGAELFDLLTAAPQSVSALAAQIAERHGVATEEATAGIEAYATHLVRSGLLRAAGRRGAH